MEAAQRKAREVAATLEEVSSKSLNFDNRSRLRTKLMIMMMFRMMIMMMIMLMIMMMFR